MATDEDRIADERYISLTTFTRDGRPKPTPVWIAGLGGGRVGFTTQDGSWKVRRIANTPEVVIQPSDVRGRPKGGTEARKARAEVVRGEDYERVRERVAAKYGWQYSMIGVRNRFRRLIGREVPPDCGIVITPHD